MTALPTRCVPREAKRAHAMRAGIGVGGVDIDVLDRHAERLGADLRASPDFMPWPRSMDDSATMKLPVGLEWTSAWLGSPPRFMPIG